jgi:hypothetical protein
MKIHKNFAEVHLMMKNVNLPRLHPLIYTWPESALAQDIENCQASDIRIRELPTTRPNMPMGDEGMKFGSDDPLDSYHQDLLCFTMVSAQ